MSHRQILPPPATVEDAMDDAALTPYRPESSFNFEGWDEQAQRALPPLLPCSPVPAATVVSTDSNPEAIIHSVPLQFQPQRKGKGRVPTRHQTPIASNTEVQGMRAQLQQLQQEKEAALAQVQRLQLQQASVTSLAQQTAANVQNTANQATSQNTQLADVISRKLDEINLSLDHGFRRIDGDLSKSFYNQNILLNTMNNRHQEYSERFTRIEASLARLGVQPQAPPVQSPQPHRQQHQAVQLLEQGVAAAPPAPPVPPPSRHIINASPSPPPEPRQQQRRRPVEDDMVPGKAPPPGKFKGKMEELEGWILQMEDYFTITRTHHEQQRLADRKSVV